MTDQPIYPQDPFSRIKEDKKSPDALSTPRESNLAHAKSDVDTSKQAQHHTLGAQKNQAAGGTHDHTGADSVRLGTNKSYTLSGEKTNASLAEVDGTLNALVSFLANYIDFIDGRNA